MNVEAGTGGLGRGFVFGLGHTGMRSGYAWGPCRAGAAAEAAVNARKGCGEQPLGRGDSGVWASMGWGVLRVGWLDFCKSMKTRRLIFNISVSSSWCIHVLCCKTISYVLRRTFLSYVASYLLRH